MKSRAPIISFITAAALALAFSGCPAGRSPIAKALGYLWQTQARQDILLPGSRDYAGGWPQFMVLEGRPGVRIRDASPFIPSFIHYNLAVITDQNLATLGLTAQDGERARRMRQLAISCLRRYEAPFGAPDAGTYGFWPVDDRAVKPDTPLVRFCVSLLQGPVLQGSRVPLNIGFYPAVFAIPTDSDVTAAAFVAFQNDALLDSGPVAVQSPDRFFSDWRDTGAVARRLNPGWLPPASGTFLTWFNYHDPPVRTILNDVDLAVNANVLHALARFGRLDLPGAQEAVGLIDKITKEGQYKDQQNQVTPYYPSGGYIFHYFVTRAFHDGPVPGLAAAAGVLADEIESEAVSLPDGTACWDRGSPQFDTALCLLSLMHAGRSGDLVDRGIAYLIGAQDPAQGSWGEGVFFVALTDGGLQLNWVSRALTTSLALEALCRYRLAQPQALGW